MKSVSMLGRTVCYYLVAGWHDAGGWARRMVIARLVLPGNYPIQVNMETVKTGFERELEIMAWSDV